MSTTGVNVPMTSNARLKDLAPTVVSEQIGNYITFRYDVTTGAAHISFSSQSFTFVKGQALPSASLLTDVLDLNFGNVQTRCFGVGLKDPVTGIDLDGISGAGLMIVVKNAFDILYNERALANQDPAATAPLSTQAMIQANQLYDYFGMGTAGYPLGKAFGGPGVTLPPPQVA